MHVFSEAVLSAQFDLVVAIATIHGSTFAGFERHLGIFAALRAGGCEHLPLRPVAISLRFPCLPAGFAALGLVSVASGGEEFLLFGTEGERGSAIGALDFLVLITHRMTSFLIKKLVEAWSSSTCVNVLT
jgi:ABC-type dipeptide/oligopeptide/nickel transport system permease subunit